MKEEKMTQDDLKNYSLYERSADLQNIRTILDFRTNMIKADINSISDSKLSKKILNAVEIFEQSYSLESEEGDLSSVYESVESIGQYERKILENFISLRGLDQKDTNYEENKNRLKTEIKIELNNILFLQRWIGDGVKFIHILKDVVEQRLQEEYSLYSFQDRGTSIFSVDKIYNVLDFLVYSYFEKFKNYEPNTVISVLGEESLKIYSFGSPDKMAIVTQMPFHFVYRTRYWGLLAHETANVFFRHWDSFDVTGDLVREFIKKKPNLGAKLEILGIINEITREEEKEHLKIASNIIDTLISLKTLVPPSAFVKTISHFSEKSPKIFALKGLFAQVQPKWETTLREIASDIVAVRIAGLSYALPFLTLNSINLSGRKEIYRLLKHKELDNLRYIRNISCMRSNIIVNELLDQDIDYPEKFGKILESMADTVGYDRDTMFSLADYYGAGRLVRKHYKRYIAASVKLSGKMDSFIDNQITQLTTEDYLKSIEVFEQLKSEEYGKLIKGMQSNEGEKYTPTHVMNAAWLKRYNNFPPEEQSAENEWWGRIIWVLNESEKEVIVHD